jgi:hypothetical protein
MTQQDRTARSKQFSHSEIIPFRLARLGPAVPLQLASDGRPTRRRYGTALKLLGILLLASTIIALSPVILMALLVIFVIWLAIVGVMAVTIVSYDLFLMLIWRMRRPSQALSQRAVPAGQ